MCEYSKNIDGGQGVCAEETCTGLVRILHELEGEEHCGGEDVERAPVRAAQDGERSIAGALGAHPHECDELVRGADGSVEAEQHLGGGVAAPVALALHMWERIGEWPVKSEADVEKGGARVTLCNAEAAQDSRGQPPGMRGRGRAHNSPVESSLSWRQLFVD